MKTGNEHQVEGAVDKVKGAVKEGFGALTGDRSTEIEGKTDRAKGSVQQKYGEIKSAVTGENDPTRNP